MSGDGRRRQAGSVDGNDRSGRDGGARVCVLDGSGTARTSSAAAECGEGGAARSRHVLETQVQGLRAAGPRKTAARFQGSRRRRSGLCRHRPVSVSSRALRVENMFLCAKFTPQLDGRVESRRVV